MRRLVLMVSAFILAVGGVARTSQAETTLRLVTAWPAKFIFVQNLMQRVGETNAACAGIVKIQRIGGPEVTPGRQQPQALRRGVFDILYGPATHYLGIIPEADALLGSNRSPAAVRQDGGIKLLNTYWEQKLNAHFLAWLDTGIGFHIYLKEKPGFKDGLLDLSGLKIRTSPTYRDFLAALGATNVVMGAGDIYTALERGIIDGTAWPSIGATDFGWTRFLKNRADPSFLQSPVSLLVNLDKWQGIPADARACLEKQAPVMEAKSRAFMQAQVAKAKAKLTKEGVSFHDVPDAKRYVTMASDVVWSRLKKSAPQSYGPLRKAFFQE